MTTPGIPFSLADARALLERTPGVLDAWLRGLPEAWVRATEGDGTWSAFDVVGHLVHGERRDWIPRLERILEHGTARPFDPFDRFAQFGASAARTLPERLDDFARLRAASLERLDALVPAKDGEADASVDAGAATGVPVLDRRGLHPALGEVTARQLLATWVAHDQDHLMQVARILGRQYAREVGPWRAYLRVISGEPG